MQLKLIRTKLTTKSTIGKLFINEVFYCYTLEDVDRGLASNMSLTDINNRKIKTLTAIPRGTYNVIITFSPHFNIDLPLLLNVSGFEGVRIHKGNKPEDTEGCILVGLFEAGDTITNSKDAFDPLFLKLKQALANKETISITIS